MTLDLRVFGIANLFIAGSSVFPTGHSVAPTFTILALARRLSRHLLELRKRRRRIELVGESPRATRLECA